MKLLEVCMGRVRDEDAGGAWGGGMRMLEVHGEGEG